MLNLCEPVKLCFFPFFSSAWCVAWWPTALFAHHHLAAPPPADSMAAGAAAAAGSTPLARHFSFLTSNRSLEYCVLHLCYLSFALQHIDLQQFQGRRRHCHASSILSCCGRWMHLLHNALQLDAEQKNQWAYLLKNTLNLQYAGWSHSVGWIGSKRSKCLSIYLLEITGAGTLKHKPKAGVTLCSYKRLTIMSYTKQKLVL